MPYYEISFETGRNSIAFYKDDEEALAANEVHNNRAKNAMPSLLELPDGPRAERVAAIRRYDKHPAEYGEDQTASVDVLKKTLDEIVKEHADENGVVNKAEVAAALLRTDDAVIPLEDRGPLDSAYKMKEKATLDLPWAEKA